MKFDINTRKEGDIMMKCYKSNLMKCYNSDNERLCNPHCIFTNSALTIVRIKWKHFNIVVCNGRYCQILLCVLPELQLFVWYYLLEATYCFVSCFGRLQFLGGLTFCCFFWGWWWMLVVEGVFLPFIWNLCDWLREY